MTTRQFLMQAWNWKPSVAIGCLLLLAAYGAALRFRFTMRSVAFFAGVGLLAIALVSPLDALADGYLLSAHMAKHIALVLVIPALLLIGIPAGPMRRALNVPIARSAEAMLRVPWLAWAAGISAMAFWHLPVVFNAALASEPLHIAEHLSLLVAGVIFWWPVISPVEESRMGPVPSGVGYLFSACLACSAIGILLTFSPPGAYAIPSPSADPRVLELVRGNWGISRGADRQTAGLLMWVPGCMIYLTAIMALFARWYGAPELSTVKAFDAAGTEPI